MLPASVRLLTAAAFATFTSFVSFVSFATFASRAAHAETRTLDGATYRVPDGWRVEEAPRSVTRHSELDRANGRYCALAAHVSTASAPPPPPTAAPTGARRTTFDDGWVAVEEADWVRASRGVVTVFVHHAAPDQRPFVDPWEGTAAVWNQVVAPRYTGVSGLIVRRGSWDDGDSWGQGKNFASASARDAEGRSVYVALFRSGNNWRWVEIVTPDRAAFEKHLTVVHDGEETDFEPLNRLANLNRFAVGPADLVGEWASSGGAGCSP